MNGRVKRNRRSAARNLLQNFHRLIAVVIVTMFCAAIAWAGGSIVIKSDELTNGNYYDLVLVPDGSVVHLMQVHVKALFEIHGLGDTLVYDIDDDAIIVRRNTTPSELLLVEPLAGILIEPSYEIPHGGPNGWLDVNRRRCRSRGSNGLSIAICRSI